MSNYSLTCKAERFARIAHAYQKRRDGETPYFVHLEDVAVRLTNKGASEEAIAVAYLHDIVEDTEVTVDDLMEFGFPQKVVEAVQAITNIGHFCDYSKYIACVKANPIAKQVKLHDILSNLADDPTPKQILKYAEALQELVKDELKFQ